jgi:hypothetical protein
MLINENQLDEWVRGNAREAQGVIVEFVYRRLLPQPRDPKRDGFHSAIVSDNLALMES